MGDPSSTVPNLGVIAIPSSSALSSRVQNLGDAAMLSSSISNLGGSAAPKDPSLNGWNSLFTSTDVKLQFVAPTVKNGKKLVTVSKSILDKGVHSEIIACLGNFLVLLQKLWLFNLLWVGFGIVMAE